MNFVIFCACHFLQIQACHCPGKICSRQVEFSAVWLNWRGVQVPHLRLRLTLCSRQLEKGCGGRTLYSVMTECFTWGVRSMLFKLLICMFVGISALKHEYETCVFFSGKLCCLWAFVLLLVFFFTFSSVVCAPNTHSPPRPRHQILSVYTDWWNIRDSFAVCGV